MSTVRRFHPDLPVPNGGGVESLILSTIDANSPAFQAVAKACGGHA